MVKIKKGKSKAKTRPVYLSLCAATMLFAFHILYALRRIQCFSFFFYFCYQMPLGSAYLATLRYPFRCAYSAHDTRVLSDVCLGINRPTICCGLYRRGKHTHTLLHEGKTVDAVLSYDDGDGEGGRRLLAFPLLAHACVCAMHRTRHASSTPFFAIFIIMSVMSERRTNDKRRRETATVGDDRRLLSGTNTSIHIHSTEKYCTECCCRCPELT